MILDCKYTVFSVKFNVSNSKTKKQPKVFSFPAVFLFLFHLKEIYLRIKKRVFYRLVKIELPLLLSVLVVSEKPELQSSQLQNSHIKVTLLGL